MPSLSMFIRAPGVHCLALAGALSVPLIAQPELTGPVVELPQFLVTDTRELPPPESWRYAKIPGFEILSNASDRQTQRLIRDFELFRQALGVVWPVPDRTHRPTMLILCGRRGKFDDFVSSRRANHEHASASLFLRNPEQAAIVLDLQSTTLDILPFDGGADFGGSTDYSQILVEHNKQLYREYIYHLLSAASPRAPAWFEEGMAQLVMAMKFDRDFIVFGQLESSNTVSASAAMVADVNAAGDEDPDLPALSGAPAEDRDFNVALHRRALVPLGAFFSVAHGAPETRNPLGNNRWAKQAYAFVHMCLYGRGGRYQQPFANFLMRLGRGEPVSEELFIDCFKMTYRKMQLELRGYIDFTDYKHQEFRAKKGQGLAAPAALELREATQAEVGRIKGEALILANKPEEARLELIAPYVRGERDPQLLAAIGLHERATERDERARTFLEAAAAASVERPRAYLELGRLRYAEAMTARVETGGLLNPAQTKTVLAPLMTARGQPPPIPAVYELIADTWISSAEAPKREDIIVLLEGVTHFPRRYNLVYKSAILFARNGFTKDAVTLVQVGEAYAPNDDVRARFADLKGALLPETETETSP